MEDDYRFFLVRMLDPSDTKLRIAAGRQQLSVVDAQDSRISWMESRGVCACIYKEINVSVDAKPGQVQPALNVRPPVNRVKVTLDH